MHSKFPRQSRILLIAILFILSDGVLAEKVDSQAADAVAETTPATIPEVTPAKAPKADPEAASITVQETRTDELLQMLQQQQLQLTKLEKSLAELQQSSNTTAQAQQQQIKTQQELIDGQRKTIRSMQASIDQIALFDPNQLSDEEIAFRSRLETLEDSIAQSQEASSTTIDADSFPSSIPIPGTAAAIRIGGFVKANMAISFDTIGSQDRFIVGTIPTNPQQQGESQVNLNVSQSRLNFDLRDKTPLGALRAFIEADFAAEGDVFRLRHAFGQFQEFLIGKTDSAFMDVEARPEELDFEGINGAINVRQTQIRFFPAIGKDWNLVLSLEDPKPEINNGEGITQNPDVIASIRRTWFERWHVKTGLLLRRIRGIWYQNPDIKDDTSGWALTLSGKTSIQIWNPSDNFLFQLNVGRGYGRYINDLSSVVELDGGQDGIFDPNGKLKALPVFSGYLAFQHWWKDDLRSTVIASYVNVKTFDFQPGNAYDQTQRISTNIIWSPISRVDLGSEIIWGKRKDKDNASGDALQWQMSAKYRF